MGCKIPIKTTLILETKEPQKSEERKLFAEIMNATVEIADTLNIERNYKKLPTISE